MQPGKIQLNKFFLIRITGVVLLTFMGVWVREPMNSRDWVWMALLYVTGVPGHGLLIKCYEVAEASAVQPCGYLQMVFVAFIGVGLFWRGDWVQSCHWRRAFHRCRPIQLLARASAPSEALTVLKMAETLQVCPSAPDSLTGFPPPA